jgi:hypothetical protein
MKHPVACFIKRGQSTLNDGIRGDQVQFPEGRRMTAAIMDSQTGDVGAR